MPMEADCRENQTCLLWDEGEMAEDVAVQMIAKSLGPSILEKQGTEGMLEAIFQYSSLMQPC